MRKSMAAFSILLAVLWMPACSGDGGPDEDAGQDAGQDAGTDGGADPGADPGADAGGDTGQLVCALAELDCGGVCTDVSTDSEHCGRCNNACGGGVVCESGLCGGGGVSCPPGSIDCNGECLDVSADPEDCGACNDGRCASREFCYQGHCVCRPGLTDCDGTCVDTGSDPAHCGGCDRDCAGTCTGGVCGEADACDKDICDGACVDRATDPMHCGACNHACAVDQVCFAGGCWDYQPAQGCATCEGCDFCPDVEPCCELPGYGTSCVDSPQPCPY
jgi:hypothetical protein